MADDERGAHLRALERMGIRLVPRPSDKLLERVALLVAAAECPNLIVDAFQLPRSIVDAVMLTDAAKASLADMRAWLEAVGQPAPAPAEILAQLAAVRERLLQPGAPRSLADLVPAPRPRCYMSGCEGIPQADGYCLEHAREAENERLARHETPLGGYVARPFARAGNMSPPPTPLLPFPHTFQRDTTLTFQVPRERLCQHREESFPDQLCYLPLDHEGEHAYTAVP